MSRNGDLKFSLISNPSLGSRLRSVAVYSILAWQYKPFKQSYEENGGYGYFNGKVEYYEVSPLSGIIIKYKKDMDLAEAILLQQGKGIPPPPGGHPEYHELADVVFDSTSVGVSGTTVGLPPAEEVSGSEELHSEALKTSW